MSTEHAEYVVLSENAGMHLVAIRFGKTAPWLRVVAAFPKKERAESYAEIENMMLDDGEPSGWSEAELREPPPAHEELPSGLPRLAGIEPPVAIEPAPVPAPEPQAAVEAGGPLDPVTPAIAAEPIAEPGPPEPAKPLPGDVVAELYPTGMTTTEIAKRAGVSQPMVSKIAKELGLPMRGRPHAAPNKIEPEAGEEPPTPVSSAEPVAEPVAEAEEPVVGAESAAVATNGITIVMTEDEECISYRGKSMDLTPTQAETLAILVRAAPNPVGRDFIAKRVYQGMRLPAADTDIRLSVIVRDLSKGLPSIGLSLHDMKGVGLSLGGCS